MAVMSDSLSLPYSTIVFIRNAGDISGSHRRRGAIPRHFQIIHDHPWVRTSFSIDITSLIYTRLKSLNSNNPFIQLSPSLPFHARHSDSSGSSRYMSCGRQEQQRRRRKMSSSLGRVPLGILPPSIVLVRT